MWKHGNEPPSVSECLYSKVIGAEVLDFVRTYDQHVLARSVDSEAVQLIQKIIQILNDPELEDSSCFLRVDAIVQTFLDAGFNINRHDF